MDIAITSAPASSAVSTVDRRRRQASITDPASEHHLIQSFHRAGEHTAHYVRSEYRLGVGSSKHVFICYDVLTGRQFAWNQVRLNQLNESARELALQEIDLLSKIRADHPPHILRVRDSWINNQTNTLYFVSDLASGGSLTSYLRKIPDLRMSAIKRWCSQLLTALNFLHTHDPPIVHRDLKADNILIDASRADLWLADFGLSTELDNEDQTSDDVVGTPEFISPEQFQQQAYDVSVDIYAFGLCVVQMLTGEIPYAECTSVVQIMKRVTRFELPKAMTQIVDDDARQFILACLHRDPEQRPKAGVLLEHPWLQISSDDYQRVVTVSVRTLVEA